MRLFILILVSGFTTHLFGQSFSTHSAFYFPQDVKGTRLEAALRWEAVPNSAQLYPTLRFSFERQRGGFFGLRLNGTEKLVQFSIWDAPNQPFSALPGEGCQRFTKETSGALCVKSFNWQVGHEYLLALERTGHRVDGDLWTASVTDLGDGAVFIIGDILLKDQPFAVSGFGLLTDRPMVASLEYFGDSYQCNSSPYVRHTWKFPRVRLESGNWVTAQNALVSYFGNDCPQSNVFGPTMGVVVHEAGPTVVHTTPSATYIW